jgi:outer membrane immunogenic protein
MGHRNNSFTSTNVNLVNFVNSRISQDVDMVTVRINYRFGWGTSPVVAKY